jgi:hypothetical protein
LGDQGRSVVVTKVFFSSPEPLVMEEEHEVYGGDIPEEVEGELEGDLDGQPDNGSIKTDEVVADDAASKVYIADSTFCYCWETNPSWVAVFETLISG